MTQDLEKDLAEMKEKLLGMAGCAEQATSRAIRALRKRDDDLAFRVEEQDSVVDRLQMEVDDLALDLLSQARTPARVRLVAVAMKIAGELERVADEATTIARRAEELNKEPALKQCAGIPPMATLVLSMLKDALDAFVRPDPASARQVIARDKEVDRLNKALRDELMQHMAAQPEAIESCLHLMVIAKSLERVADHATNVAEAVVYLHEGCDIRHMKKDLALGSGI
jgi:phosphate transport system protein